MPSKTDINISFAVQHGVETHRGLNGAIPRSQFAQGGFFGRMFRDNKIALNEALLNDLSEVLKANSVEPKNLGGGGNINPTIPAGYTFLGQFIDHDITFDPTSSLERQNDLEAIFNFRTPYLELDNVYGAGPSASPHLYDANNPNKLLLGRTVKVADDATETVNNVPGDLPRNIQGTALIGDPRNDENLIVSQLHLVFLKFHNKVVDRLTPIVDAKSLFSAAQRVVRWHYQWLVVNEFLRRVCGVAMVDDVLTNGRKHFTFSGEPFMPLEFAVAAYRFGHSMVRGGYSINAGFGALLFPRNGGTLSVKDNLGSQFLILRDDRQVDWTRFFEMKDAPTPPEQEFPNPEGSQPQASKLIDTVFSSSLFDLPQFRASDPNHISLPLRNMLRGVRFSLPFGQAVARTMGEVPLTEDELGLTALGFMPEQAPLWYYILKEAELRKQGHSLGAVGGRIVAEVLMGLLEGDTESYLSVQRNWTPGMPIQNVGAVNLTGREDKTFHVSDLISIATA